MMTLLLPAAAMLMQAPFPYRTIDQQRDSWWECIRTFRQGEGERLLSGRIVRTISLDGTSWSETYELWGSELRYGLQTNAAPQRARHRTVFLSVHIPPTPARNGGEIYGDLYGDGELVATATMLDSRSAREDRSASTAYFDGRTLAVPLGERNRWTFVARHADGTEIVRRDLPVPDRAARERAYAADRSAIDAAWAERDESQLVTTPAGALSSDRANCLLSTPAAREEIEQSSIGSQ